MQLIAFLLLGMFAGFGTAVQQPTQEAKSLALMQFVEQLKANPDAMVLDVRRPGEVTRYGSWPGAQNLDYTDASFGQRIATLDPKRKYLLYCASGGRAELAAKTMAERGFTNVAYLTDAGWNDLKAHAPK